MISMLITFLPLAAAMLMLFLPKEEKGLARGFALSAALINFFVSLALLTGFDPAGWSSTVDIEWVKSLGIRFHLGVDGISLYLVLMTTFLVPVVLLSSWNAIEKHVREFLIAVLVLESGMIGTFLALDLFVFYVFWEVMLIPMYFIVGIWGGERRLYASIKFVLYTMVGSLLMIVAILYLYQRHHDATGIYTFDYQVLSELVLAPEEQLYCFLAFALAFCIKVPVFPLHTWLPDAHVEAPTAGSVLLAAVMLKFGTYGLLRFAIPFFPAGFEVCAPYLGWLSVIGIIYGSLVAFVQKDIKKTIAYSSVAHLGVVVLGLSVWNQKAIDGAVFQMLAHGASTGGLFLAIGALYERRHTRGIDDFGGVAQVMPRFFGIFLVIVMASIGLPGTSGFVGEFITLLGTFSANRTMAILGTTGVVLSAVYMLRLFQKVMFGPLTDPRNRALKDLGAREIAVFVPMIAMALWLGIFPNRVLSAIDPAVARTIAAFKEKKAVSVEAGGAPRMLHQKEAPAPTDDKPADIPAAPGGHE